MYLLYLVTENEETLLYRGSVRQLYESISRGWQTLLDYGSPTEEMKQQVAKQLPKERALRCEDFDYDCRQYIHAINHAFLTKPACCYLRIKVY